MRSALLILCTLVLLVGGYFIYAWFEPAAAKKSARNSTATSRPNRPPGGDSFRGLGGGESVWVKSPDPKTGELSYQFKADKYDPQSDGTVHVEKPQAEFFSNDGRQRVRVEGSQGDIVVPLPPEETPGRMQSGMQAVPPSRGKLQDVVISVFEPPDAAEPVVVAKMNNAAFDNDTFRIATESYVDSTGNRVEADQVPIAIRGRDYDCDGKGLVIRWNDRDRKLQLLEVTHGESLTIKNPEALTRPGLVPTTGETVEPTAAIPVSAANDIPMLASADPRAFILAAADPLPPVKKKAKKPVKKPVKKKKKSPASSFPTSRPKIARDHSPVVYRASFEDDLRIYEGDKQIVAGDRMDIDLLQASSKSPSTQTATAPTSKPAKRERKHLNDEEGAATKPAPLPIVVKWTGKLRVVPIDGPADPKLVPGKAAVQLTGSPLLLTRDGIKAHSGVAMYNSADASASLRNSPAVPEVTLTDANGVEVTTPQLDFIEVSPTARTATLVGRSRADLPLPGDNGRPERLTATWVKDCQLHLTDDGAGNIAIERANLQGEVHIEYPQMNLSSDALALNFDPHPATTRPTSETAGKPAATSPDYGSSPDVSASLKDMVASGNVVAHMSDGDQKRSTQAQRLRVEAASTPSGHTYVRYVEADGKVITSQNGRELHGEHLRAELAPTTRPTTRSSTQSTITGPSTAVATTQPSTSPASPFGGGDVKLVSLTVRDAVKLITPDGTSASADLLTVDTASGAEVFRLTGKPLATVTDGKTTLSGPEIVFSPGAKSAQIIGPGTLQGSQPDDPKQTIEIAWVGGAFVDGAKDWIDITDKIVLKAKLADGTMNTATSDRMRARLAPKVVTQPAKAGVISGAAVAATQPNKASASDADSMNFLAGKDITSAELTGHVNVNSELKNVDGSLARAVDLIAETILYDRPTGRMEVPGEGQMLYQDYRLAEAAKNPATDGQAIGSGRGRTAFLWKKSLIYDEQARQAVMSGDVKVVHEPEDKNGQPFTMLGQILKADMEPDPAAAAEAAEQSDTQPTTRASDKAPKLRLKQLSVEQDVKVTSQAMNFEAHSLIYDAVNQIITASGNAATPIVIFDEKGRPQTASELQWNTKTDQFRIKDLAGNIRR